MNVYEALVVDVYDRWDFRTGSNNRVACWSFPVNRGCSEKRLCWCDVVAAIRRVDAQLFVA